MARGSQIIVSSNPKGVFMEGIIYGTPVPGTLIQVRAAALGGDGRHTWEPAAPVDGDGKQALVAVLDADWDQGQLATSAYVTGTRCFIYIPIAGEEVNVLLGEVAGTANSYAIGDQVMMDAEDGILVPNSTGTFRPFTVLETVTQVSGSHLTWCMRN